VKESERIILEKDRVKKEGTQFKEGGRKKEGKHTLAGWSKKEGM
jgi:hypothetical protein